MSLNVEEEIYSIVKYNMYSYERTNVFYHRISLSNFHSVEEQACIVEADFLHSKVIVGTNWAG